MIGSVAGGVFHGENGTRGEPGYMAMDGAIGPDGRSLLAVTGLTASPRYTTGGRVSSGTAYRFDVASAFEPTRGTGRRLGNRSCAVTFTRQ